MAPNPLHLLEPKDCALLLVDQQAGLAFGVGSIDRQVLMNNVVALAKTATVFGLPVVASTSATKVYSGPLMPTVKSALPGIEPIDRRSMNVWEDDKAREAVLATGRNRLIVSGLLTEACVTFVVLSALSAGMEVYVVGDACGGSRRPAMNSRLAGWRPPVPASRPGSRSSSRCNATGRGTKRTTALAPSSNPMPADTASASPTPAT